MYNITLIEGTSRPLRSSACTGNFGDCHFGSDRQHHLYHLSSKTELASSSIPLKLGADDSPLSTLLSLVATSLLHSLQSSPLAAIGSRHSCSAVHNHINYNRYCFVSAYASHMSFLRICNLIGGTRKSDPAQNPNSSYTRPFSSRGVAQLRERGWLARPRKNGNLCGALLDCNVMTPPVLRPVIRLSFTSIADTMRVEFAICYQAIAICIFLSLSIPQSITQSCSLPQLC